MLVIKTKTNSSNTFDIHPIFDPVRFRINTPPIKELHTNLTRLVWTGATGAALLGFTRGGKTTAVEMVSENITSRSGHCIPVIRYSVHRRDQHRIRSLLENISAHLKLNYHSHDSAEALSANLLMYLAETAKSHHVNQLIFVIDEAQRLAIPQIDLFAELDDRLRKEFSMMLMCLFVGNLEQMGRLLDEVRQGENEHIEGRFFRQTLRFRGLRSKGEVKFCLSQYDKLRYPNKGPTYTEYFLQKAFTDGFRLASLFSSIWEEYKIVQKELSTKEWAMEYFVRAVNTLLTDYLPKFGVNKYTSDMFRRCIDVSGLNSSPDVDEIDS
jgi:hypothetical protein